MRKDNSKDIAGMLSKLNSILNNKPSKENMTKEVRMMNYKMRPLKGDFSLIHINDSRFIEILWKLGKLDDFFQREITKTPKKQKDIVINAFHNIHMRFQQQLNKINLKDGYFSKKDSDTAMEIIREHPKKKTIH